MCYPVCQRASLLIYVTSCPCGHLRWLSLIQIIIYNFDVVSFYMDYHDIFNPSPIARLIFPNFLLYKHCSDENPLLQNFHIPKSLGWISRSGIIGQRIDIFFRDSVIHCYIVSGKLVQFNSYHKFMKVLKSWLILNLIFLIFIFANLLG